LDTQVLIVGAGPTGLSVACHLLRLGVRVRIIDKKSGFSTTSKAIGLQYRVPRFSPAWVWSIDFSPKVARQRRSTFTPGRGVSCG